MGKTCCFTSQKYMFHIRFSVLDFSKLQIKDQTIQWHALSTFCDSVVGINICTNTFKDLRKKKKKKNM